MYGLRWCGDCQFNYMPVGVDKDKHQCESGDVKRALNSQIKGLDIKIADHSKTISNAKVSIDNCEGLKVHLKKKIAEL
jgi:hypothetical protein